MRNDLEDDDVPRILRDPAFWHPPAFLAAEEIEAIVDAVDAEDERAEALCETLLAGPSTQWRERFSGTPEARTPAMVRQLLRRMPALLERKPADALHVTSIAVVIAEVLNPRAFGPDGALTACGQALREHAYMLSAVGRHDEAFDCIERAERAFQQIDAVSFDLARLAAVKESVLLNRGEEAIRPERAPREGEVTIPVGELT